MQKASLRQKKERYYAELSILLAGVDIKTS